jgi:DNA-binding NarL/FixJ family response regulator
MDFDVSITVDPTMDADMIKVLLVDDYAYIRMGIQHLLETTSDIEVVDTAVDGIDAVTKSYLYRPDVVIIDISMPLVDGLEATKKIRESCPGTRVLALSVYHYREYVNKALQAGAAGYLTKEAIGGELIEAIRSVYDGKRYFSKGIAEAAKQFV